VTEHRRRLDTVLEPEFLENLDQLELDELRKRRHTTDEVESQISYYRRLLHGRMDLLNFEVRRRRGEEEKTLLEALPEILASGMILGNEPTLKHLDTMPPLPNKTGRRLIDKIMDDGILTRLPDLTDEEVGEALERLSEVENEMSNQRKQLHVVIDRLQDEIVARYRAQQGEAPISN